MSRDEEGFLSRYTAADHHRRESAEAAHYDLLREHGWPRESARTIAAEAAGQQLRELDRVSGAGGVRGVGTVARPRVRVRFAWEPPEAGIDL